MKIQHSLAVALSIYSCSGSFAAIIEREVAVTPPTLAERAANKNLYLRENFSTQRVAASLLSHGGVAQRFVDTGSSDVSLYSHAIKFSCGSPACHACLPSGFIAAVDLEGYLGEGPFWSGVRNIGGGFGIHRHVAQGATPTPAKSFPLPDTAPGRELFVATVLSPQWVFGATFGGAAGALDCMVGAEPYLVVVSGEKVQPTTHWRLSHESCMYSPALHYKNMSARLFGALSAAYTFSAYNREWGMSIAPGGTFTGLIGLQAAWGFACFGSAYGYSIDAGGTSTIVAINTYQNRFAEYVRHEEFLRRDAARGNAGTEPAPLTAIESPIRVAPQARTHSLTSYVAFALGAQWTLGLSGVYAWKVDSEQKTRDVRLVLSYKV